MSGIVFVNGQFYPENQPVIPVTDRGFLFGDGVFTTIKLRDGQLEFLEAHIERLRAQCMVLQISFPNIEQDALHELIKRNDAEKGVWRVKILITGGNSEQLNVNARNYGYLVMMLKSYRERGNEPCKLITFPEVICTTNSHIKTLSYLSRLQVADYAMQHHCDDAVVFSPEGFVLETSFSNVFWRTRNDVFTPDPSLPLLYGVALAYAEEAIKQLGCKLHYVKARVPENGQLFICNSMRGIQAVDVFDKREYARDEDFEEKLLGEFRKIAELSSSKPKLL